MDMNDIVAQLRRNRRTPATPMPRTNQPQSAQLVPEPTGPAPGLPQGNGIASRITRDLMQPQMGEYLTPPPAGAPQMPAPAPAQPVSSPLNVSGGNPFADKAARMGFSDFANRPPANYGNRGNIMNMQAKALRGNSNG